LEHIYAGKWLYIKLLSQRNMEKKARSLKDAMEGILHADFKIGVADQQKPFLPYINCNTVF